MSQINRRQFLRGMGLLGGAIAVQSAPPLLSEGVGARPIKWGMITPTTGPYATEAFDQVEGVKIAIEDINREGGIDGRQVELLFRDDQFKWDQTTTHALDLLDNHHVDFLSGSMVGPEEVRLNELSDKRKIIYANYPQHILSTPDTAKTMSPLFFTANTTPYQLAGSAATYISQKKLGKRIHVLADDYVWPKMFMPAWAALAKKYGLEFSEANSVSWVPFPTSFDYSASFPKILRANADIVYVINWGTRQVAFVKQALEAGLHKKSQIILANTDVTIPEAAGKGAYDGFFAAGMWHWTLGDRYPGAKRLNDKYLERRRRPASAYGAMAHDLTRLILDTARETKLYKPKDHFKLAKALEGRKFQYSKGESWIRPCDHVCVSQVFFLAGVPEKAMKGDFDHLKVVGDVTGEENELSCEAKGVSGPASSRV